jgi:hypothetical protein
VHLWRVFIHAHLATMYLSTLNFVLHRQKQTPTLAVPTQGEEYYSVFTPLIAVISSELGLLLAFHSN